MNYLLDTDVLSEMRKLGRANPRVKDWATRVDAAQLFLSAVTIFEIELGTRLMERRDSRQGAMLRTWIEDWVLPAFSGRILPIDTQVAIRCATLHVPDPRSFRDSLIAAAALVYGMTVVTGNTRDFASTGVPLVNPWLA